MLSDYLASQLEKVYQAEPWYGPGLLESLNKLPEMQWQAKLGHRTVAGLVGHIIAWRKFVVGRLADGTEFDIEMNTRSDWPDCSEISRADLLTQLAESQTSLLTALAGLTDEQLAIKVPAKYEFSKGDLALGIMQHDVYHVGQINLLVSLLSERET
ncbi:MAG: DinB family protein [Lewinella sp.]